MIWTSWATALENEKHSAEAHHANALHEGRPFLVLDYHLDEIRVGNRSL